MEFNSDYIAVYDNENNAIECKVISRFKNEETGKSYLVYTDESRNELGKKNMFVVSYEPDAAEAEQLRPIETEEEWASISEFLNELRTIIDEQGLDA